MTENGNVRVGDPRHIRIENARQRLLELNFFVPLRQFVALGMSEFQRPADGDTLRGYYSQASGLTHFFMHSEGGQYRDALIEHLAQIYSPNPRVRAKPASLAELTGVPMRFHNLNSRLNSNRQVLPICAGEVPSGQSGSTLPCARTKTSVTILVSNANRRAVICAGLSRHEERKKSG